MAAEIGVSPSYLNHLERNQRPVTARVLLRLAEAYDVDLQELRRRGRRGHRASTSSPRSSPIRCSAASRVPRYELVEVADNAPAVGRRGVAPLRGPGRAAPPAGRRRTAEERRAAGARRRKAGCATISRRSATISLRWRRRPRPWPARSATRSTIAEPLRRRLKEGYRHRGAGGAARDCSTAASQHYDLHRKRLMLSALLRPGEPHLRARLSARLDRVPARCSTQMVEAAAPPDAPTRRLLHMSLANYAARRRS